MVWCNENGNFTTRDHYNEDDVCGVQCTEAANKKLMMECQEGSSDQAQQVLSLISLRPLGLGLQITPSLLISVQNELSNCYRSVVGEDRPKLNHHLDYSPTKDDDFGPSEKLKAANFNASFIKIGSWERTSRYENDLVAKCYFAKKKLVWEVLQNCRKSKIEIQWSDITAIRATTVDYEPGTLEIELNNPPTFHEEVDPQPRKHTIWKIALDFTGGEASRCRRHLLRFPPGALDKHYQNLLQNDPRLFELSHKGFPSPLSLHFDTYGYGPTDFSFFGFNGLEGCRLIDSQFVPSVPSTIMATRPSFQETTSPISDEHFISNRKVYENQGMRSLAHGMSNYPEVLPSDQVQGLMPTVSTTQLSASVSTQYYNLTSTYGQGAQGVNFDQGLLRTVEKQLLSDLAPCDDKYPLARIDSWNVLANLENQRNHHRHENDLQKVYFEHDRTIDSNSIVLNGNENVHVLGSQFYQRPQPVSRRPPLVSPVTHQAWNNLGGDPSTASFMTDPRMEHLSNDNSGNGLGSQHHWT